MIQNLQSKESLIRRGIGDGMPIFIGYFPAAVAFGLLSRNGGLLFPEALFFSMSNFAGASQFLALKLTLSGSAVYEIIIGVLLVNLRYLLMSASLAPKVKARLFKRSLLAFGNTDEVFAVASMAGERVPARYMVAMESVAWCGWVSGTITGFLFGAILPASMQLAVGGSLYALFAALLVPEIKREQKNLLIALLAGGVNTAAVFLFRVPVGWAFVLALISTSLFGAWYLKESAL